MHLVLGVMTDLPLIGWGPPASPLRRRGGTRIGAASSTRRGTFGAAPRPAVRATGNTAGAAGSAGPERDGLCQTQLYITAEK